MCDKESYLYKQNLSGYGSKDLNLKLELKFRRTDLFFHIVQQLLATT